MNIYLHNVEKKELLTACKEVRVFKNVIRILVDRYNVDSLIKKLSLDSQISLEFDTLQLEESKRYVNVVYKLIGFSIKRRKVSDFTQIYLYVDSS